MRLVKHEPALLSLSTNESRVLCPFCTTMYSFSRTAHEVYNHFCPQESQKVFFLNGFAWTGVFEYLRTQRPPGREK